MAEGVNIDFWEGWKVELRRAFGFALSLEQWTRQVVARVRLPNETIMGYSYSKLRLCRRCPFPLTDVEIVRHLTRGLNDSRAEYVVLSSRPYDLPGYFEVLKDVELYSKDRDAMGLVPEQPVVATPVQGSILKTPSRLSPDSSRRAEPTATPVGHSPHVEEYLRSGFDYLARDMTARFDQLSTTLSPKPPPVVSWRDKGRSPNRGAPHSEPIRCYRCDGVGHYGRDCSNFSSSTPHSGNGKAGLRG